MTPDLTRVLTAIKEEAESEIGNAELVEHQCAKCGETLDVPRGYDFNAGDWCWECCQTMANLSRATIPSLVAALEKAIAENAAWRAQHHSDVNNWAREFCKLPGDPEGSNMHGSPQVASAIPATDAALSALVAKWKEQGND